MATSIGSEARGPKIRGSWPSLNGQRRRKRSPCSRARRTLPRRFHPSLRRHRHGARKLIGVSSVFQGASNPGGRNRSARRGKKNPTEVEEPITVVEGQHSQAMIHGQDGSSGMLNLPGLHGTWQPWKTQGMMLKEDKTLGVSMQQFHSRHPGGQVPETQSQLHPSGPGTRLEMATRRAETPRKAPRQTRAWILGNRRRK